ncbi:MAG: PIN domain-containing protein [Deltaproteobacteria bacterium]|nr:PIN domain-containing protein [Deltaproteobacteria bacterium]
MIAVDTNILIYAHRDIFPEHERALRRLCELTEGSTPWALPVFCIAEFFRVVTHPKVLSPPTQAEVALTAIDRLLAAPTTRLLLPGHEYPAHFASCARSAAATGNVAFDVQIAALCREHGIRELLTADRDFARFSEIAVLTLS